MTLYVIRPSVIKYNGAEIDYARLPPEFAAGDNDLSTVWVTPRDYNLMGDCYLTAETIAAIWDTQVPTVPYTGAGTTPVAPGQLVRSITCHAIISFSSGADLYWSINYADSFISDHVAASGDQTQLHLQLELPLNTPLVNDDGTINTYGGEVLTMNATGASDLRPAWAENDGTTGSGWDYIPYISQTPDSIDYNDTLWNSFTVSNAGEVYTFNFTPSDHQMGGRPVPIPASYAAYQLWIVHAEDLYGAGPWDLTTLAVAQSTNLPEDWGAPVFVSSEGVPNGDYVCIATLDASPSTIPTPTYDDPDSYSTAYVTAQHYDKVRVHEWWVEVAIASISQTVREIRRRFTGGVNHSA